MVWLGSQRLERNMIGKLVAMNFEDEVCSPYWMGNKVKIFTSYVNTRQRVTSAEEDFDNQVDRATYSMDTSQPFSPATPVVTQWAHKQRDHGGRDGGYAWAQKDGLPLIKGDLAMVTAEHPICLQ